ncbi:MAG: hypothetical protein GEV05_24320 [Betaproteobacteria bacterium]|nr:hypothetical protein [Betaproteobacteria bacterium]
MTDHDAAYWFAWLILIGAAFVLYVSVQADRWKKTAAQLLQDKSMQSLALENLRLRKENEKLRRRKKTGQFGEHEFARSTPQIPGAE